MTNKGIILIVLVLIGLFLIDYSIAPKIEFVKENGKEYVISINGKPTWRELTDSDRQEAKLTEKKW